MKLIQNVWRSGTIVDFDERYLVIASGATPEIADHIARAVNALDDLVAALEAALHWGSWDGMGPHPTSCPTTGAALSTKNCVPDRDNQGRTNT